MQNIFTDPDFVPFKSNFFIFDSSGEYYSAFSKIKEINLSKGEEEQLEKTLKEEFQSDFFVKVQGDKIKVVTNSQDKSLENVNKIMVKVQENYASKVHVTVEFK